MAKSKPNYEVDIELNKAFPVPNLVRVSHRAAEVQRGKGRARQR
ncbi:MAG: hypothetical protein ACI9HK_005786 [Pirellulaceae bacterium]|jgi:hypothetical protein